MMHNRFWTLTYNLLCKSNLINRFYGKRLIMILVKVMGSLIHGAMCVILINHIIWLCCVYKNLLHAFINILAIFIISPMSRILHTAPLFTHISFPLNHSPSACLSPILSLPLIPHFSLLCAPSLPPTLSLFLPLPFHLTSYHSLFPFSSGSFTLPLVSMPIPHSLSPSSFTLPLPFLSNVYSLSPSLVLSLSHTHSLPLSFTHSFSPTHFPLTFSLSPSTPPSLLLQNYIIMSQNPFMAS